MHLTNHAIICTCLLKLPWVGLWVERSQIDGPSTCLCLLARGRRGNAHVVVGLSAIDNACKCGRVVTSSGVPLCFQITSNTSLLYSVSYMTFSLLRTRLFSAYSITRRSSFRPFTVSATTMVRIIAPASPHPRKSMACCTDNNI